MPQVPTSETSRIPKVPEKFMVDLESQNLVDYVGKVIFPPLVFKNRAMKSQKEQSNDN